MPAARIRAVASSSVAAKQSMKRSNAGFEAAAQGAVVVRAGGNADHLEAVAVVALDQRRDVIGDHVLAEIAGEIGEADFPAGRAAGRSRRRRAGCGPSRWATKPRAPGEQVGRVVGKLQQRLRVQRRPAGADRLDQLPLEPVVPAPVAVRPQGARVFAERFGQIEPQLHGAGERGRGLRIAPELGERHAAIVMGLRRVGLEADRLVVVLDRLGRAVLAVAHDAEQDQHVGIARLGPENFPVDARRLFELAAQLVLVAVVKQLRNLRHRRSSGRAGFVGQAWPACLSRGRAASDPAQEIGQIRLPPCRAGGGCRRITLGRHHAGRCGSVLPRLLGPVVSAHLFALAGHQGPETPMP